MDDDNASLLKEVRDAQKQLLERQGESLNLQREQLQLMQRMLDERDHAGETNRLHRRGRAMMDRTSYLFLIIIFLLVLLLFYVSWALFA